MNLAASYRLVDLLLDLPPRKGGARDWDALMRREMDRQEKAARAELTRRLEGQHYGTKPSRGMAAYTGTYEHPAYGKARVTLDGERLVLRWSSFTLSLKHFHYDTFAARDELLGHLLLTFELDAGGRPVRLTASAPLKATFKRAAP